MCWPVGDDDSGGRTGAFIFGCAAARVDDTLDACTRCGKCVAPARWSSRPGSTSAQTRCAAIVEGILDLLAGGDGTPEAERWAQVCTNSGKCIPACDYGVNPRFMVNMARIAAKAKLGDVEVRRAAHEYFTTMSRSTRVISRLQLRPRWWRGSTRRCAPPANTPRRRTSCSIPAAT